MKILIPFLFFGFLSYCNAHTQILEIDYICQDFFYKDKHAAKKHRLPLGMQNLPTLKTKGTMTFNSEFSYLNIDSFMLTSDEHQAPVQTEHILYNLEFYSNTKKNMAYFRSVPMKDDVVAVFELKKKFKITNEYRNILGFKCRKALLPKDERISIWYTEEIPYPFGPDIVYCGLPGLVLQVDIDEKPLIIARNLVVIDEKATNIVKKELFASKTPIDFHDNRSWLKNPRQKATHAPNVTWETPINKWLPCISN